MTNELHSGRKSEYSPANKRLALLILAIALIVFVTRLPFVTPLIGNDPDSERMLRAAHIIRTTGEYERSRFVGFPIPEYAFALALPLGPPAINALTAMMSAAAAVFFGLTLRRLGARRYLLAALAMALTPVVYINSTSPNDYIWAFAFIMAALYFVVSRRLLIAGVMLGLAIGCRAPSILMIIPFALYLAGEEGFKKSWPGILKAGIVGAVVGGVCYIPGFLRYGFGLMQYVEIEQYPPLRTLIKRGLVDVWGVIGLVALAVALFGLIFLRRRAEGARAESTRARYLVPAAWLTAIVLNLAMFLRLPFKPDYFVPIVPFVLLLLWMYLRRAVFAAVCALLIVSPFVLSLDLENTLYDEMGKAPDNPSLAFHLLERDLALGLYGPVFADFFNRKLVEDYARAVIAQVERMPEKTVVVSAFYEPPIALLHGFENYRDKYLDYLPEDEYERLKREGYRIVFLPGAEVDNRLLEDFDLEEAGIERLRLDQSGIN